jgi:hypothetical protein
MRRAAVMSIGILATALGVTISDARAQNVTQADLVGGGAACPRQDQGESEPNIIPGLDLVITTHGRPVELSYTVGFVSSPQGNIHLIPVINGVLEIDRQLDRAIGDFLGSGQSDTVSFSRIYWLPRGTHTLALASTCHKAVHFVRGWLIAKELPTQRRHGQEQE